jgi:TPR repeat protein
MKLFWKIAVPIAGVVLVCGAAIGWHFAKVGATQRKLAEDARAFRVRADQGDAEAQFKLGVLYYQGKGVPQNYSEALRWYQKSADQGYAKAQYNLSDLYYQGKGVQQDYSEAVRWSRKAADQGYARAQAGLASMYYEGKGVPQDYAESVRWSRKAADQGDAWGQAALASAYYDGRGVPQDYTESVRWSRKAAEQGFAIAQYALGFAYYEGKGVAQDYTEAAHWYRKAAEQGDPKAQYALGYMYSQGKGVPRDDAEAARWYRKAAKQGNEYAQRALDFRKTRLSTGSKIRLAGVFLASISLLFGAYRSGGVFDPKQRVTTTAGLLGLSWVGLDVYGSLYFTFLQAISAVDAFYFFKYLLTGACLAMFIFVLWPAKIVLRTSGALFILNIGLSIYFLAHYHVTRFGLAVRLLFCTAGLWTLWIGMLIPSAIFWLEGKKTQSSQNANDGVAAPGSTAGSG